MNDETQTTRLRDVPEYGLINYDIFHPTLIAVHINLMDLFAENLTAFCDLVDMARDRSYVPFDGSRAELTKRHLLTDGIMHDDVRAVVLASVDGPDMVLREPVA